MVLGVVVRNQKPLKKSDRKEAANRSEKLIHGDVGHLDTLDDYGPKCETQERGWEKAKHN